MGVTIDSKIMSMSLGYIGFRRLRTKVAFMVNETLGEHYKSLDNCHSDCDYDEHDKKTEELFKTLKIPKSIFYFLYSSDCEAELTYKRCEVLYKAIKDYEDNKDYGYSSERDNAVFEKFNALLKDCIASKCKMEWC